MFHQKTMYGVKINCENILIKNCMYAEIMRLKKIKKIIWYNNKAVEGHK